MKSRSTVLYWVVTLIFCLAMLMDGVGGITKQEAGQEVMRHLGFPIYAMVIFGVAKILGVIAVLQPKYKTIKEWAYAGFVINCAGAFASRIAVGDSGLELIFPLIILAITLFSYFVWKRHISATNK
ncbi:MAG: DoxX family protein [Bacteroidota bacterium]